MVTLSNQFVNNQTPHKEEGSRKLPLPSPSMKQCLWGSSQAKGVRYWVLDELALRINVTRICTVSNRHMAHNYQNNATRRLYSIDSSFFAHV